MTRKFLWGIIVVLLITNLTTLLIWVNVRGQVDDAKNHAAKPLVENRNEPVALVGGEPIEYEEWEQELQSQYGKSVLSHMIDRQVVFKMADQYDVRIDDKLIQRELSLMETMLGVMEIEEIEAKRKEWIDDVRYRFYLEELLTKDIGIETEKIKSYYKEHEDQYDFHETYQLSQILVKTQQEANKVKKELDEGASFEMLAREYSVDGYTKDNGGYLGYFSEKSQYLPGIYYRTAQDLSPQSYSSPFNTDQGFVLLYVHRKLPSITFSFEEVQKQIKRELALEYVGDSFSAKPLWEEAQVDWVFGD